MSGYMPCSNTPLHHNEPLCQVYEFHIPGQRYRQGTCTHKVFTLEPDLDLWFSDRQMNTQNKNNPIITGCQLVGFTKKIQPKTEYMDSCSR